MKNLKIYEFKKTLENYIRQTDMPEEVKRMVLADILREQEAITYEVLKQEIAERNEVNGNAESAQ